MTKPPDDKSQQQAHRKHPLDRAGLVSQLFFFWMFPYIWTGYKRDITLQDLPTDPPRKERCAVITEKLIRRWNEQLALLEQGKTPSLTRAVIKTFSWPLFRDSLISIFAEVLCRTYQAYSVGQILHYIYERGLPASDPVLQNFYTIDNPIIQWTLILIISSSCWVLTAHFYGFRMLRIGLHLRAGCAHLIYNKSLKLSQSSLRRSTIGQMVTLLSNDLEKFNVFTIFVPFLWIGPLQTILSLYLIWPLMGPTIIGVLVLLAFLVPLQIFMSFKYGSYRGKIARSTDTRVRLVNEIISSLRLIKTYAWEYACQASMAKARKEETDLIFRVNQLKGFHCAISFISGKCIIFVTIALHCVAFKQPLTPQVLFVCIAMLGNIQVTMTRLLPLLFSGCTEAYISLRRINEFLLFEEKEKSPTHLTYDPSYKPFASNFEQKTATEIVEQQRDDGDDIGKIVEPAIVEMTNVCAKWTESSTDCALKSVNLKVETGSLTIICGPVASGKSSLFLALLNELPIESGKAKVNGKIAYASQEAWIFAGTIRENILLNAPFDSKLYWEVVKVCALERDLQLFENGDNTYVSDKGVSLSGGQKARISLARSLYRDCDIYLLDDPLSAIDAHVQSHIFEQAIEGFLRNKTVLLATHQLHYLKRADQIIVMKEGQILAMGTFKEIQENCDKVEYLYNKFNNNNNSSQADDQCGDSTVMDVTNKSGQALAPAADLTGLNSSNNQEPEAESLGREFASATVWWQYFTGSSTWRLIPFLVMLLMTQVTFSSIDVYLTVWTIIEQDKATDTSIHTSSNVTAPIVNNNNTDNAARRAQSMSSIYRPWYILESQLDTATLMCIYAGLILALFTFSCLKNYLLFANNSKTANVLYSKLFNSALFARISYFDKNPIGRFLNRATSDIGLIDEQLPLKLQESFEIILLGLASVILVALVDISMIVPSSLVILIFIAFHQVYIKPARDIKRFENVVKSPILSHLATSLSGLTTIRASGVEPEFEQQFIQYQDQYSGIYLLYMGCNRWLAVSLDWMNCLFISSISIWSVVTGLDGSSAGLVITNAIMLCCLAQTGIMCLSDSESMMTSIERVSQYCNLPREDHYDDDDVVGSSNNVKKSPKKSLVKKEKTGVQQVSDLYKLTEDKKHKEQCNLAPVIKKSASCESVINGNQLTMKQTDMQMKQVHKIPGAVEYRNVYLYYDDLERPVLKDLTFKIEAGEKVGIVGRTGAGKSSILTTLFRLYDFQGQIFVEGIDSKTIGLKQLRRSISIIPQDPVLFTDTVRLNVDPFSEYDDHSVWRALELANLKGAVLDMKKGLNSQLSERGGNLSVGQRQLMCLARALLKPNHILVMDEATANVDPDTDEIIQGTVRREFAQWTVLIIAHRLNTIIDCDRVIVMDAGRLVDIDEPYNLINKTDSHFANMLAATGKSNEQKLRALAKQAHDLKNKRTGVS